MILYDEYELWHKNSLSPTITLLLWTIADPYNVTANPIYDCTPFLPELFKECVPDVDGCGSQTLRNSVPYSLIYSPYFVIIFISLVSVLLIAI